MFQISAIKPVGSKMNAQPVKFVSELSRHKSSQKPEPFTMEEFGSGP